MEKCHWVAIGYSLLEHQLGKSEFGSLIGLVKKLGGAMLRYIHSSISVIIKRGKL